MTRASSRSFTSLPISVLATVSSKMLSSLHPISSEAASQRAQSLYDSVVPFSEQVTLLESYDAMSRRGLTQKQTKGSVLLRGTYVLPESTEGTGTREAIGEAEDIPGAEIHFEPTTSTAATSGCPGMSFQLYRCEPIKTRPTARAPFRKKGTAEQQADVLCMFGKAKKVLQHGEELAANNTSTAGKPGIIRASFPVDGGFKCDDGGALVDGMKCFAVADYDPNEKDGAGRHMKFVIVHGGGAVLGQEQPAKQPGRWSSRRKGGGSVVNAVHVPLGR